MSPTVFRVKGYKFFLSNKEKRIHIHAVCEDGEAKFWIEPIVSLATSLCYAGFLDDVTKGIGLSLGQEEKKIRTDPAARVTELLKTVFGK